MKESSKEIWKPVLNFIYFLIQSYGGNTRYCDSLADNTHWKYLLSTVTPQSSHSKLIVFTFWKYK